jgi:opacity protein-like surface antigen
MVRNILLASVLALGVAGAAQAADSPRLVGGLGNGGAQIKYSGAPGNVVGGGTVALNGGGDDRSFTYGAVNPQQGRFGRLVGGGTETRLVYDDAPQPSSIAAVPAGAPRG